MRKSCDKVVECRANQAIDRKIMPHKAAETHRPGTCYRLNLSRLHVYYKCEVSVKIMALWKLLFWSLKVTGDPTHAYF